jgi:hypothetical protein
MVKHRFTSEEKKRKTQSNLPKNKTGLQSWKTSIKDPGLQTLQKMVGNRTTQDLIMQQRYMTDSNFKQNNHMSQIQLQKAEKFVPTTPLLKDIESHLAPWFFDKPGEPGKLSQNPNLSKLLLTVYAKIGKDLWDKIFPSTLPSSKNKDLSEKVFPLKFSPPKNKEAQTKTTQITYVSEQGDVDFVTDDKSRVYFEFYSKGYRPTYYAKGLKNKNDWGLREPNMQTAGLHVLGRKGENKVNIHIDLHPPSWNYISHFLFDYLFRERYNTPETLQAGVEKIGIYIPILYEQKIHGKITARLNQLASQVKGDAELQTEINEGRQHLAQAGQILWTKEIISNSELANATLYLKLASGSMWEVEHFLKKKSRNIAIK